MDRPICEECLDLRGFAKRRAVEPVLTAIQKVPEFHLRPFHDPIIMYVDDMSEPP